MCYGLMKNIKLSRRSSLHLVTHGTEGKHTVPHHSKTKDQHPNLATNQLTELGQGNWHLCLSCKLDVWWVVVRIKELNHVQRPEQFWAQGQCNAGLGDHIPTVVCVGGTPGAVQGTAHAQTWHRTSAHSIVAILIIYWVLTMYWVMCWVIFKGFLV